ncbi:CvpA family protein [Edaphobacter sp. 4G125]|nr:CvpA family protein [Edaphobacter sp. 4G125]
MNPLDWLLIAIVGVSAVHAFVRGLILELFSLGGLLCGILLAAWNYQVVATSLAGMIPHPGVAKVSAFLLIAVAVMILATLLGRALHSSAHAIGLGFLDRLGGAAFGMARGCLTGVAILMALTAFLPDTGWLKNSFLTPYFLTGAHAISFVVPHDLEQLILDGGSELKHNVPDWIKSHPQGHNERTSQLEPASEE